MPEHPPGPGIRDSATGPVVAADSTFVDSLGVVGELSSLDLAPVGRVADAIWVVNPVAHCGAIYLHGTAFVNAPMTIYPLLLDDGFRDRIMTLVEFASKPENYYVPDKSKVAPGDKDGHWLEWGAYRIVYSLTVMSGDQHYRHLSVSLPTGYPNFVTVWTIAHWIGFTGAQAREDVVTDPPHSWLAQVNESENCIVLVERIGLPG